MTEYDQERLSELAEELDRAKETIRCLEGEVKDLKRELREIARLEKERDLQQ